MCRRSDPHSRAPRTLLAGVFGALCLAAGAPGALTDAAGPDPDSTLERYLSDLGLQDLLVAHLEERLAGERTAGEKSRLAARLADLYAVMLEGAQAPEERLALVERGRRLLASVPDAESIDLRISLHRATFARAEELLERSRLRLAGPEAEAEAEGLLAAIAPDLTRLAAGAVQAVNALQQQEEATGVSNEFDFSEHLSLARRRRSLTEYLAGWAKTYLAEFAGAPAPAAEALTHFGWLLNAPPGQPPTLDRIPASLLQYEHVSRAVLGAAVCKGVLGRVDEAGEFLDVLEHAQDTAPAVRDELFARRMTILARNALWLDLAARVDERRAPAPGARPPVPAPLPAGEARLLAVLCLDTLDAPGASGEQERARRATVARLAEQALADLVARDELAQVLDLTSRYGSAAIPSEGFLGRHVRAVREYESARAAHRALPGADPDAPAADGRVAEQYKRAVAMLRAAFDAPDSGRFPEARAATALLLGLSLFYSTPPPTPQNAATRAITLSDAADWLSRAADLYENDAARRADSLAMAVRALDEAGPGPDGTLRAKRDALARAFLERFPADERAGTLLIRLASAPGVSPEESVALLLQVRPDSPAHEAARQRAARALYDLFRAARPAERDWAALRYAEVEQELFALDRDRALAGDADAASRALTRGRRLLDALLSAQAPDTQRAAAVLGVLRALAQAGRIDETLFAGELLYREAQIALASGDEAEAERIVAALLGAPDAAGEYQSAAARLLHRRAVLAWRDARRRSDDEEALAWARRVVERGSTLLLADSDRPADGGAPERAVMYTLRASVAEAAADIWTLGRDPEALALALDLHRALLDEEPGDRAALRRLALLAEDAGDTDAALSAWRRLASGLRLGSDEWFEARYHQIAVLSLVDLSRARDAMTQHRALWPSLGPEPWGDRFRALDASLTRGGTP